MSEHDRHIAHQGADTLEARLARELADKTAPVDFSRVVAFDVPAFLAHVTLKPGAPPLDAFITTAD